jgi:L-iditol 2-dehydrogenase
MKAIGKYARGKGCVALMDVSEPQVLDGHVVIEVKAAGLCGTDIHIYHDEYPTNPPVTLGHEVAGTIAQVGRGVNRFRRGDRVTAEPYYHLCGNCRYCRAGQPNLCPERRSIGSGVDGAFARYVLVPERSIHILPDNVDTLSGALTEPLACCVHALECTRVEPGDSAVIAGPGAIGLLMTQVAAAAGARVVVLGTSADADRLEQARMLGAGGTLDVQDDETAQALDSALGPYGADVVFECSGAAAGARTLLRLVRRGGRYAQVGLFGHPITWDLEQACYKELQVSGTFASVPSSWRKALALLGAGQVRTRPLISHELALEEWREAFRLFEERRGVKIVFTPAA